MQAGTGIKIMEPQPGFIEQLCRAYEAPLLGYLTQMVGRRDVAQELAQDAFMSLYQAYRPEELLFPRAALFKVATNFALMHLRHRRTENAVSLEINPLDDLPDPHRGIDPEQEAAADEICRHLTKAIEKLRPTLHSVFVMGLVQGKPRKEIASALGISEKRVDKRMTKALRACRTRLVRAGIDLTA
jgi:RNA polymerase sigma factor (sigma-70 family)